MAGTGNPELDREIDRIQKQVKQALAVVDQLSELTGEAESEDGYIRVTVQPNGMLDRLDINPRAMKQGSEALSEEITKTILAAQQSLATKSQELMAPLTGDVTRLEEMVSKGTIQEVSDRIEQSTAAVARSENPARAAAEQLDRLRKMMG
ncbi:YbaB/EbfC family nucleoid-associated protein [Actinomadura formosensis]|uniref:YbaB/EbfC family nucleoid-associated protein n=1 Tax=Actinomadura formosensis TaxID=60706 RepID=UPI00083246B7|nr:YbaB/EbfC family nucleoid-associated protein [Actinomadura formosensis]